MLTEHIVQELFTYFKQQYGFSLSSASELLDFQQNVLEFVVNIGRKMEQQGFDELGTGYEGNVVSKDGKRYAFKENRAKSVHGLFGIIQYKRSYYRSIEGQPESWIPLDEKLGIEKKHTPGCNYFSSFFTGQDTYQESLDRFHEIFRPDGRQLISMRKFLDMDYQLGSKLEGLRQREIQQLSEGKEPIESEQPISGTMAVSIDATKVRHKVGEELKADGSKAFQMSFKDAKVAAISAVQWEEKQQQSTCTRSSYVTGVEHADEFFLRIWVEMHRRCKDLGSLRLVFLADGAEWIWDRVGDLSAGVPPGRVILVLDFYHASERISDLCKVLYGEGTQQYWRQYKLWRDLLYQGAVTQVLEQMRKIQAGCGDDAKRKELGNQIHYFKTNRQKMRYDEYRKMGVPIGSGTVESACKHLIGRRMKLSGMTWSEKGAKGMLQIRASVKSNKRFRKDFIKTLESEPEREAG